VLDRLQGVRLKVYAKARHTIGSDVASYISTDCLLVFCIPAEQLQCVGQQINHGFE
jgi:hypothetical protein